MTYMYYVLLYYTFTHCWTTDVPTIDVSVRTSFPRFDCSLISVSTRSTRCPTTCPTTGAPSRPVPVVLLTPTLRWCWCVAGKKYNDVPWKNKIMLSGKKNMIQEKDNIYPLRRWANSRVVCWTALWNITLRMHHCHWARGGLAYVWKKESKTCGKDAISFYVP